VWFCLVGVIGITVWRRRAQLIPQRGMGVRADIGRLRDAPRVRVRGLTMTAPDSARLALETVQGPDASDSGEPEQERAEDAPAVTLEFSIAINETEPGYPLLQEWMERQCILGVVLPPDSPLIRLRCLDDLQPLTLRRLDLPT
jgi:hypothetical protein